MFKKSKFALVAVAALLLAGCGGGGGSSEASSTPPSEVDDYAAALKEALTVKVEGIDIKSTVAKTFKPDATRKSYRMSVWSETEAHPLFLNVLKGFVTDNAYDPTNNVVYEFSIRLGDEFASASTTILADVSLAPDVFGFPDDQVEDLVNGGVLQELTGNNKNWAVTNNVETSIASGTFNNKLYAYPQTADNGYFLYYNSEFLTPEDVSTMDNIFAKLKSHSETRTDELKSQLVFDFENAWYIPSFFFHSHAGEAEADPVFSYDPTMKKMNTTITDEAGQNAARGFEKVLSEANKPYIQASGLTDSVQKFSNVDADGKPRVPEALLGVSGTWDSLALKAAMGEGYAATHLPTFTPIAADGTALPQQQMGSFAGSKLIGVSVQSDATKSYFAHKIAQLLTNAETQIARFKLQRFGPSNIEAQKDPDVVSDVALAALNAQAEFAVSQSRSVNGKFWDPGAAFGKTVVSGDYGEEGKTVIDFLNEWANAITVVDTKPEE